MELFLRPVYRRPSFFNTVLFDTVLFDQLPKDSYDNYYQENTSSYIDKDGKRLKLTRKKVRNSDGTTEELEKRQIDKKIIEEITKNGKKERILTGLEEEEVDNFYSEFSNYLKEEKNLEWNKDWDNNLNEMIEYGFDEELSKTTLLEMNGDLKKSVKKLVTK